MAIGHDNLRNQGTKRGDATTRIVGVLETCHRSIRFRECFIKSPYSRTEVWTSNVA